MESLYQIIIPILTALITGVIGPVILYYLSSEDDDESEDEDSDNNVITTESEFRVKERSKKIDSQIKDQLDEIKESLDADRAWIVEFHDKKKKGKHRNIENLKKFSMVYESVSPGVSTEKENFENLLVSFFIETFRKIIREKELFYEDISDIDNEEIRQMFKQKGNSSMYMFAMETIDDILIGILGVDYVREKEKLTEREKMYLRKQAYSLAGYLQNRDFDN